MESCGGVRLVTFCYLLVTHLHVYLKRTILRATRCSEFLFPSPNVSLYVLAFER